MVFDDVKKFMDAGDQFEQDPVKLQELYLKLIGEEYGELFDALGMKDEVETFDACLDLIWVIVGFMHSKGWNAESGWKEVDRSNMSKVNPETGKMDKREDGKIIKHPLWSPPNLLPFMNK